MTLLRLLIRSHLWIGLCAGGSYLYSTETVPELYFNPTFFFLIVSATTALYNFLGLLKNRSNKVNKLSLGISGLISMVLALKLNVLSDILIYFPALILGVLYGYIPSKKVGLRELPLLKIFLISLVWVYVTLGIPWLTLVSTPPKFPWLLFCSQVLFVIATCIPFDIRDMSLDHSHMKTIPQIIGVRNSVYLSMGLVVFSLIFLTLHCNTYAINSIILPAICVGVFSCSILYMSLNKRDELYYTGLVDGLLFIQGTLFWLSN